MKKRRTLILSLLALFLVVGIPAGFALSEFHHIQVNRALVAAVKADDTHAALVALNAGAVADYPRQAPRPLWLQWLDRITGLKAPANDMTPSLLAQAVQHNNTVLVKALLEKGATDVEGLIVSHHDKDSLEEPIPLLAVAAEAGNLAICQALVEHGADVNCGESKSALRLAAEHGRSEVIHFLFQHAATLDTSDEIDDNSLMAAARSGDLESVRLLLAHGADAKYEGRFDSVLSAAVHGGNLAVVKLVVEAGADVNGGGAYTCVLQDAAELGNVDIVRYLLKKGAKVNAWCKWHHTPLLDAVMGEHTVVVKLLLEHGADWRPKADAGGMGFTQGDTALRVAQRMGNRGIVQMLKKAGAKE